MNGGHHDHGPGINHCRPDHAHCAHDDETNPDPCPDLDFGHDYARSNNDLYPDHTSITALISAVAAPAPLLSAVVISTVIIYSLISLFFTALLFTAFIRTAFV